MLQLGILKTWNADTHQAGVQLVGSLTTYLDNISVATNIAPQAMVVGNYVLVAIPGGNPRDACVVASWPAGSSGGGGGVTDHGELTGLGDDDHTQYLNVARHDLTARHPLSVLDSAVCSETEADSKITTHKGDASAHHTKTTAASEITSGRFGMPRMPDGTDGYVLTAKGAGVDPVYAAGGGGGGTKIQDADADTKVDVEAAADEDKVRMNVKGVEAFLLDDAGVLTLAKQSRAAAHLGANQNISTNTWTKINLNVEDYDEQGEFDVATNYRFTAKKAGYYFVVGQARYVTANLPQTACYADVRKNGGESITMTFEYSGNGVEMGAICIHIFQLAVNDYLELWTWQNSGSTQQARGYALCNRICIYKIG